MSDMPRRFSVWHGVLVALLFAFAIYRQVNQQTGPAGSPSATAPAVPAAPAAGGFDYYLLSLSWSPTYCLTHQDDQTQCGRRGFGFVLHGLWPQNLNGQYPEQCASNATLTEEAFAFGRSVYPSPKLVSHEWEAHGTCSGMDALSYFRAADRARTSIRVPPQLEAPADTQVMSADQVLAAFQASNPGLPADAIRIECSRGQLSEVRLCLARDLTPMACGRGVRSSCRDEPVTVRAAR